MDNVGLKDMTEDIFANVIKCEECGRPLDKRIGTTRPSDDKPVCKELCMTYSQPRSSGKR